METILDVLFIKNLERRLGRKLVLAPDKIEERDNDVIVFLNEDFTNFVSIPKLRFPDDVISDVTTTPGPHNKLIKIDDLWTTAKYLRRDKSIYDLEDEVTYAKETA